nr:PTS transporter subunit IIC [uncultured Anaerostipes sp.]
MEILNFILGLGSTVMLPIIIFVFGLIMRAGFSKSFKSGVTIGIGFTGINLVITLLTDQLGPVAQAMTQRLGLDLQVIDIGWPAMSSISWAWAAAGLMIPIGLVINFAMLTLKLTKTMNVDIWNYWQFAFVGYAVTTVSGSLPMGIVAASALSILALILADYTQPYVEKFFGMPGISFPHLTALGFLPLVVPLNWLIDKIPGLNKLNANPETIRKRFGIFGEPMSMGLIIGLALGLLGGQKIDAILQLAITMAAVMYLMPKMVAILMEGLIPISEAAREFMAKHFGDREIFIGLDAAVSLGEPSVIAVGLLLVPITIFLAIILPGNKLLPFADLAVIPFIVCLITAMSKGNVIRALIVGTVVMACCSWLPTLHLLKPRWH